jgi:hypothetical protein
MILANAGGSTDVLGHVGQAITPFTAMPRPIAVGDQVRLVAGYDRPPRLARAFGKGPEF